ncbi:hypothetical protein PR003_g20266 [Phytophthora rubi]|uniref:Uncharacterized protein n=1 Tax=Phytophthora rubi TaxID=129364 RepID=A0A6A3K4P4_9STRA|nr:hypothetical protein PR002_g19544 [Phytophthora rubi]KAE8999244.1 hypothetical protein PR001_g19112 [Phytophthora rubi]KAE9310415.1 hypothetical protein PR003_g20266 [Phytophthora rubi]
MYLVCIPLSSTTPIVSIYSTALRLPLLWLLPLASPTALSRCDVATSSSPVEPWPACASSCRPWTILGGFFCTVSPIASTVSFTSVSSAASLQESVLSPTGLSPRQISEARRQSPVCLPLSAHRSLLLASIAESSLLFLRFVDSSSQPAAT